MMVIGCGVFVDLQKAFDIVDHHILSAKLNRYRIHGVSYNWIYPICVIIIRMYPQMVLILVLVL